MDLTSTDFEHRAREHDEKSKIVRVRRETAQPSPQRVVVKRGSPRPYGRPRSTSAFLRTRYLARSVAGTNAHRAGRRVARGTIPTDERLLTSSCEHGRSVTKRGDRAHSPHTCAFAVRKRGCVMRARTMDSDKLADGPRRLLSHHMHRWCVHSSRTCAHSPQIEAEYVSRGMAWI